MRLCTKLPPCVAPCGSSQTNLQPCYFAVCKAFHIFVNNIGCNLVHTIRTRFYENVCDAVGNMVYNVVYNMVNSCVHNLVHTIACGIDYLEIAYEAVRKFVPNNVNHFAYKIAHRAMRLCTKLPICVAPRGFPKQIRSQINLLCAKLSKFLIKNMCKAFAGQNSPNNCLRNLFDENVCDAVHNIVFKIAYATACDVDCVTPVRKAVCKSWVGCVVGGWVAGWVSGSRMITPFVFWTVSICGVWSGNNVVKGMLPDTRFFMHIPTSPYNSLIHVKKSLESPPRKQKLWSMCHFPKC